MIKLLEEGGPNDSGGGVATAPAPEGSEAKPAEQKKETIMSKAAATPAAVNNEFVKALPERFQNEPTFQTFKSMDDFLESHLHLRAKVGDSRTISIPKDDATAEEWKAFYKAQGAPDGPDGYKLSVPDAPETKDRKFDPQSLKDAEADFHEAGLTPKQAKLISERHMLRQAKKMAEIESAQDETIAKNEEILKGLWGEAFDEKISQGKLFLNNYVEKQDAEVLEKMFNDKAFESSEYFLPLAKIFARGGQELVEDSARKGGVSANIKLTPERAQQLLNEKIKDPEWGAALVNPSHSRHEEVKRQSKEWNAAIAAAGKK